MRKGTIIAIVAGLVLVVFGGTCVSGYNGLVSRDQAVKAQWAQVESVYQRRADLIPNLVATVKGAARFEQDTIIAVTEARARVGQATRGGLPEKPEDFQKFQQAQDQLGGAISRLLVVAEAYPDLKATAAFRDLMAQLEGTENRIAVERMRYNETARDFNSKRSSFPTTIIAGMFGKFAEKPYFTAQPGAAEAPKVQF